jgi:hypothetical protein
MKHIKAIPAPVPALPDIGDFGPAMQALTPLQRGYVIATVYYGLNHSDAARAAGYSEVFARTQAYTLGHHQGVQDAILEVGRALLRGEGARSFKTVVDIRDDASVRADTRLKAAEMIMNRSGFHLVTEHHEHTHRHLSDAEMDKRILALCAELNMSPEEAQKMLIAPADMERNAEGVFEIIPPPPRPEPSPDPRLAAKRATYARRRDMTPEEIEADKQRIQAERSARMKRERAEFDAARAGEVLTPMNPNSGDKGEPP